VRRRNSESTVKKKNSNKQVVQNEKKEKTYRNLDSQ
jgi:hypothetical protein